MPTHHRRWHAMATLFEAFLEGDDDEHLEAVSAAIEDEVRRIETMLSRFDPASEISRINRDAANLPVRVSPEVGELFAACERYRTATGGTFDLTAGTPHSLELAADFRTVHFTNPATRLDLGGIGKGYALDSAAKLLRQFHISKALLHAGTSSVLAFGEWPIDIRDPAGDDLPPVSRITLRDRAISCSATLRPDQFESDVIDPQTAKPLTNAAGCVVLAATATEAEALSTAFLVLGRDAVRYSGRIEFPGVSIAWIEGSQFEWLTDPP